MNKLMLAALASFACALVSAQTVYSNNSAPGDMFTNAGAAESGQAIASTTLPNGTGWYYADTRNGGSVGIRNDYARSGNGSVYMDQVLNGPNFGAQTAVSLLPNAALVGSDYESTGVLGSFGSLTQWSYEFYRDASSADIMPVARVGLVQVVNGNPVNFGMLVYDPTLNGFAGAADDTWHMGNMMTPGAQLWATGGIASVFGTSPQSMSTWQSNLSSWFVYEMNAGVGRSTPSFTGAVDNYTIGFTGGFTATANFEVVPEPATGLFALLVLPLLRRRKR